MYGYIIIPQKLHMLYIGILLKNEDCEGGCFFVWVSTVCYGITYSLKNNF
jgi:hypothetical protein